MIQRLKILIFGIIFVLAGINSGCSKREKRNQNLSDSTLIQGAGNREDVEDMFVEVVQPVLVDLQCAGCHNTASATGAAPYIGEPDVALALKETLGKINPAEIRKSRLVVRLEGLGHNCKTSDTDEKVLNFIAEEDPELKGPGCQWDARIMESAIAQWVARAKIKKAPLPNLSEPGAFAGEEALNTGTDVVFLASDISTSDGTMAITNDGQVDYLAAPVTGAAAIDLDPDDPGFQAASLVTYAVVVPQDGTYRLFVESKVPAAGQDTYFTKVGVDNFRTFNSTGAAGAFAWEEVSETGQDIPTYELKEGITNVVIKQATEGLQIAQVALTTNAAFNGAPVTGRGSSTLRLNMKEHLNEDVVFVVTMARLSETTSIIQSIAVEGIPAGRSLTVKGITPVVNGTTDELWSTYRDIDVVIPAPGGVVSPAQLAGLGDVGYAEDVLQLSVKTLELK